MHFYIETISKEKKKGLKKGRLTNFKKEKLEIFSSSTFKWVNLKVSLTCLAKAGCSVTSEAQWLTKIHSRPQKYAIQIDIKTFNFI